MGRHRGSYLSRDYMSEFGRNTEKTFDFTQVDSPPLLTVNVPKENFWEENEKNAYKLS